MAAVKFQLEELKKPYPRYALELHTIRGMIQEADNMDKGFKAVIQRNLTPPSSTPADAKSGGKRDRDDVTNALTPGVSSAPLPKRVKRDWEGVRRTTK